MNEGRVTANGLDFAYLETGSGPLALCLHGFPDSPYAYRHLMPALAEAGYRAVAPFMRGYAPTAIPADGSYTTTDLVNDANGLHEALGGDGDAVVIGHDWGTAPGWGAPVHAPERWRKVVVADVPPLPVLGQILFAPEQIRRAFHFWFFQMAIADAIIAAEDLAFINYLWASWSPDYDASEDLPKAKDCLRDPANLPPLWATTAPCATPPASARKSGRPNRGRRGGPSPPSPPCTSTAPGTAASS
jgi:pimeloyl-ACP methyl ester carboxylesterase